MVQSNIAFLYWGRRGFSRFTLEAARAAQSIEDVNTFFSVSTSNEIFPRFCELGDVVFPVDTFSTSPGALLNAPQIFKLKRQLINWLTERNIKRVISLMPHIWTPLISKAIKRRGIHYAVIIHDGRPHLGDPTGLIFKWLLTDAKEADTVITLSPWVRDQLIARGVAPAERIKTIFMPDVTFPSPRAGTPLSARRRREPGQPIRIVLFGRLLRYKGIPLFVDAMENLFANKIPLEISVCGEGNLNGFLPRLERLGATVVNRWLSDDEVGQLLMHQDVAVLTHVEASQSGVISAAMGAGLPVVTTPVGGLAHQVKSRGAGLVSASNDAEAVADCIRALALDHTLYNRILDQIESYDAFSMQCFLRTVINTVSSGNRPEPLALAASVALGSSHASASAGVSANVGHFASAISSRIRPLNEFDAP
jgi:glycosyltransferase involved in cell wall biosynthesis